MKYQNNIDFVSMGTWTVHEILELHTGMPVIKQRTMSFCNSPSSSELHIIKKLQGPCLVSRNPSRRANTMCFVNPVILDVPRMLLTLSTDSGREIHYGHYSRLGRSRTDDRVPLPGTYLCLRL